MLKLSIFTDEVSQNPERAVKLAVEFGLRGVEIRSVWDTQPQHLAEPQIAELKRLLDAHDLKAACIASPFLKCNLWDEAAYEEHFEILRRCIALGKSLGTNLVRGFTGWKTEEAPEVWAEVESLYRQVIPLLEAEEVVLGIENEHDTNASTAARLARFLEKINHPRIRAVWDPTNEVFADDGETPYPEAYQRVKPFIVHVHVKDALRDEAGQPHVTLVGQGAIDWKGQLKALADAGYDGFISLETHWRMMKLPEEILSCPAGPAFTKTAEETSRRCLAGLVTLLPTR